MNEAPLQAKNAINMVHKEKQLKGEIHLKIEQITKALCSVRQAFRDDDTSEDNSHPWIPGASSKPIIEIVEKAIDAARDILI